MTDFLAGGGYQRWLSDLGTSDAPMTRAGLATALNFFHAHMPTLPRPMQLAFLKGTDLHKPVRVIDLEPGDQLVAFRKYNEDPVKLFYSRAGTPMDRMGLNPSTREFNRFRVAVATKALESRCAPALDTWTDDRHYFQAQGGALQLIVPDARKFLEWVG